MRLTKKSERLNQYVRDFANLNVIKDMTQKLGQLEDIEEELGIDLITLFKALKNGIYKKENEEIKYISPNYLVFDNKYLFEYEYCTCRAKTKAKVYPYSLKKYGKTWALTKEELL